LIGFVTLPKHGSFIKAEFPSPKASKREFGFVSFHHQEFFSILLSSILVYHLAFHETIITSSRAFLASSGGHYYIMQQHLWTGVFPQIKGPSAAGPIIWRTTEPSCVTPTLN